MRTKLEEYLAQINFFKSELEEMEADIRKALAALPAVTAKLPPDTSSKESRKEAVLQ